MNCISRHPVTSTALAGVTAFALFGAGQAALAQAPRPQLDAMKSMPMPNEPAFRDPKTGQVWTPANVGEDGKPLGPNSAAFDPSKQVVSPQGTIDQSVPTRHVGTVPMNAGPTVPLVKIDNLSLRETPGSYWRATLYLDNNSKSTFSPIIGCEFNNGGRAVERTRGLLPPTAGGERVGFVIWGPPAQTFVDSVHCHVDSP
ncbi:hypothetical protein [Enhydrobacter sp.]|jgi:hypothetical protein|uniref:hypothetical protein n=1 Tax=Enhydrobacter sp. TaxID=1894999 RepID=UPI0026319F7B|nr:hypothetical protein [Enhydrobacter sp.]WIM09362.1 MAG: hypothetical protein OJF58_000313 [Enhydrobacter sp.]